MLKTKRIVVFEKLVIYLLLLWPLFFYSYLLFPSKPSIEVLSFKFTSSFHEDIQIFAWTFYLKLNIMLLLLIWFLTNREWWRFAIIPILSYTIFQIIGVINDELNFFNESSSYEGQILICFLLIPIFIKIHNYINYRPLTFSKRIENDTKEKLAILVNFDVNKYNDMNKNLNELNTLKSKLSEKEYLIRLLTVQVELDKYIK